MTIGRARHPVSFVGAPSQPASTPRTAAARPDAPHTAATATVLIDTHAHYYPCFGAARFLNAATRNFERPAASLAGATAATPGHLVIAATRSCDGLSMLRREIGRGRAGLWRLEAMREHECTLAVHAGSPRLVLIAAHQAATAEGLEVLAIGTWATVPDGLPLRDTVRLARDAGAVVVIPYGLGKWWLGRGRLLRDFLDSGDATGVCLGDSACRPRPAPTPTLMRCARGRGVPVLAGTDPLPLPRDATLAGSYGVAVRCAYDAAHPLASLAPALLSAAGDGAQIFGVRRGPLAAASAQAALRLARRGTGAERGAS